MRTLVAALVVVVVAGAFFLLARGGRREGGTGRSTAAPAPERAPDLVAASALNEERDEERPATAGAREAREAEAPTSPGAAPVEPVAPELVVSARLVDERGAPVAGGTLRLEGVQGELARTGGANGEVVLAFASDRLSAGRTLRFEAGAPGRTRRESELAAEHLLRARSAFLGELVLLPAGTLVGRVVDEHGAPVREARVVARTPPGSARPTERVFLPSSGFGDGIRASATSADDGSFRVEGVPAGPAEVLAGAPLRLVARSDVLEVRAGAETRVAELVLASPEVGDRIAGRVTDAGAPFAGVRVALMNENESVSYASSATSDADGRFELLAARELVHTLVARDPATGRQARARGVRAGELGVEIACGPPAALELFVRDGEGPVEAFRVVVENADRRGLAGQPSEAPGRARVELPREVFHLNVISPLHRPLRLGPFEPRAVPARLEVVLERAGGVAGVVRAGGVPVPGAEVHAHGAVVRWSFGVTPGGFATFVEPYVSATTRADDEGRFFLALRTGGRFRLHASAPGAARAASEWLEFTDGGHIEDLELALPAAGALEGRLLVAPGADARGAWIGASDGEGHVELAQTDPDGAFAFAGLAPGRWQVRRVREEEARYLPSNSSCSPPDDEDAAPAWDVEVRAGTTARHDLDARDELPCTLEGRLAFGGVGAGGLLAYANEARALLDAEGRFLLRIPEAGSHSLWLGSGDVGLTIPLELHPGPNAWELDLPAGELVLENLPPVPRDPRMGIANDWYEYALLWSSGDASWRAMLQQAPSASVRLTRVPAGRLALRWRAGGAHPDDVRNWPVLAEIELSAGALVTLRLP